MLGDSAGELADQPASLSVEDPAHDPRTPDRIQGRQAKGSPRGRPPDFDADLHEARGTVGRGLGRLKQWRGIATRYDKHALIYLDTVVLPTASPFSRHALIPRPEAPIR